MDNPTMPLLGEEAAKALSGTTDSGTGVKHQAFGVDDQDTPSAFSRLMNREHNVCVGLAAMMQGLVINMASGLNVGVYAIRYPVAGVEKYYAGSTGYTLPANETSYIYLDNDETIKHSTTGWPEGDHFKLAVATTDATTVTAVQDRRFQNFQNGVVNNWWTFPPTDDVDFNAQDIKNLGFLSFKDFTELTIASGVITPTQTPHTVDTEGEVASDDLTDITAVEGAAYRRILILVPENAARVVTVKSTGNVTLLDGDFVMDAADKLVALIQNSDTTWVELFRNKHTVSQLEGNLDANEKDITNIGTLNLKYEDIVIASGVITKTHSLVLASPEIWNEHDDLDTINGGVQGDKIVLMEGVLGGLGYVTVKHNTGNIKTANEKDFVLKNTTGKQNAIVLLHLGNNCWQEVGRSSLNLADLIDTAEVIPYPLKLSESGALSVGVWKQEYYCHHAFTIKNAYGQVNTAPSGGDIYIDIRDDGASIFANQADMVHIADGTNGDLSATVNHEVAAGSFLTLEGEGVSMYSAADATVSINGFIAPKTPPE